VPVLSLSIPKRPSLDLPPYSCAVDYRLPLARGLAYAALDPISFYDQRSYEMPTHYGTLLNGSPIGMVRGFGSTYGSAAATNRIETQFFGQATQRTFSVWAMRNGAGGNNVGRIFECAGVENIFWNNASSELYYGRNFSTTNGFWSITGWPAGEWRLITVTYDSSDVANNAQFYVNGLPATTAAPQAPVGTASSVGVPYFIGNNSGALESWDGLIGPALFWDRLLSPGEIWSLYDPLTRWELWRQPRRQAAFSYDVGSGQPTRKRHQGVPGMRLGGVTFGRGWAA
jgi:hypothetical protein